MLLWIYLVHNMQKIGHTMQYWYRQTDGPEGKSRLFQLKLIGYTLRLRKETTHICITRSLLMRIDLSIWQHVL